MLKKLLHLRQDSAVCAKCVLKWLNFGCTKWVVPEKQNVKNRKRKKKLNANNMKKKCKHNKNLSLIESLLGVLFNRRKWNDPLLLTFPRQSNESTHLCSQLQLHLQPPLYSQCHSNSNQLVMQQLPFKARISLMIMTMLRKEKSLD